MSSDYGSSGKKKKWFHVFRFVLNKTIIFKNFLVSENNGCRIEFGTRKKNLFSTRGSQLENNINTEQTTSKVEKKTQICTVDFFVLARRRGRRFR